MLFLVGQGHTDLSLELDGSTQLGIDSDDVKSKRKVGRKGVSIDTIDDLDIILENIPIENLLISFETDFTAPILYAMFILVAEKRKIPLEKLKGSVRNDFLGGFVAEDTLLFPPKDSFRLLVDTVEFITEKTPHFHGITTHGTRAVYDGITAMQEIAFSLCKAMTYIENCVERGLEIDDLCDKISFNFHTKSDFFEEIAKYRAIKKLWTSLIVNLFHGKHRKSEALHFNSICEPINSASTQLENNLVRIAYQVMASSLGGAHTISCRPFDQNFSTFNKESLLLALRTQQILSKETGISISEDSFSGSFFLENLTNQILKGTENCIQEIEANGGITLCIEREIIRKWSLDSCLNLKNKTENVENTIFGLDKLIDGSEEKDFGVASSNQERLEEEQIKKLTKIKTERDTLGVSVALEKLEELAKKKENLIPPIMNAIKLHATIGEIVTALKNIFGEYVKGK